MKYRLSNIQKALVEVYTVKAYFLATIMVALLIFSLNVLLINYKLILSQFSFELIWLLILGAFSYNTVFSLIFLFIISVLGGIVLSMGVFLLRRQVSMTTGAASSSALVGLIAPTCPTCALGLFGVLGLGGFMAALPFKGLELGFVGLVLLIVSIVFLSGKINTNTCSINGGLRK